MKESERRLNREKAERHSMEATLAFRERRQKERQLQKRRELYRRLMERRRTIEQMTAEERERYKQLTIDLTVIKTVLYRGKCRSLYRYNKCSSICWKCRHAVPERTKGNGCSWSRAFEPIPGWHGYWDEVAHDNRTKYRAFMCLSCPQFERG